MKNIPALSFKILLVLVVAFSSSSCRKTCDDGKKNQKEEEVDCGGPCEPCVRCDDGEQNGRETGVDCGGNCTPCATVFPYQNVSSPVTVHLNKVDCEGSNCVAIGDEGTIIISGDAGASWKKLNFTSDDSLKGVQLIGNSIIVCGANGLLKRSEDNGNSFIDIKVQSFDIRWNDVLFFTEDSGLVCGENFSIFYTYDGGQSWNRASRTPSTSRQFYAMSSPDPKIIYAVGDNRVSLSQDGGRNWAPITLSTENPEMVDFTDLYYYSTSRAFASGRTSVLFSQNSVEWYDKALYTKYGGISFKEDKGLYAGRDVADVKGKILETLDSGITWTQIPVQNETVRFNDCFIIDASNSIIVGEKGTILRR